MAPIAISPPPPSRPVSLLGTYSAPIKDVVAPDVKYDDWRADLQRDGYVVIKGAIPHDRAVGYQRKAHDWLKSFSSDLDLDDPETWVKENLPVQSKINTFNTYRVCHEKFMWDARMEPGVLKAFETLWGTDKLLASFDALNVTLPNRKDVPRKTPWEHVDQSPLRRGLHCVQGVINLSPSGPEDGGLLVYPRSHVLFDEFFDTQTDQAKWEKKDIFLFSPEHLNWFAARGVKPHKVCADVGDLLLWDSRTVHYGSEPSEKSNQIRTVIYAAFTPARLASPEQLKLKAQIFSQYGSTTHWPHDNINPRATETYLEHGMRDPRDRDQPLELPELNDKLLKLAGVKAY